MATARCAYSLVVLAYANVIVREVSRREATQVLLFVCLPALLLLTVLIVLLVRWRHTVTSFAGFSVSISRVTHEDAYITYRDEIGEIEFYAATRGRKVIIGAPKGVSDEDMRRVLPNLTAGLKRLHLHYRIHLGDGTIVS